MRVIPLAAIPLDQLTARLLDWIQTARRDLPWRRDRRPYAVWIAEVMLQQTQAATVAAYYERWMRRFPDLATLAAAPLDDVLKAWEGLGYYARARHLHRAARQVMARHGGELPAERQALLALPGIGPYTAGAILSLAFGQRAAVLDGNVRRVLCRIYDVATDPTEAATEAQLWQIAETLVAAVAESAAGPLNEALMELGSLICTPRRPACSTCPVTHLCLAHARGVETERPVARPRARPPHHTAVAGIIQDDGGACLLIRRPARGLLGGLWGFPGGVLNEGEVLEAGICRTIREQIGIEVLPEAAVGRIEHAYTHFRITLHVFRCQIVAGQPQPLQCAAVRWTTPDEWRDLAFPVTDSRIIRTLTDATAPLARGRATPADCVATASRFAPPC
ncbi:MAG: A/G-specific adenine glycosylase [Anaerolineae bacterium]